MKDQPIIDIIIWMLQSKWYVRCWYDNIRKEHFDYITQNLEDIMQQYDRSLIIPTNKKSTKIKLMRLEEVVFDDDEEPEMEMRTKYNPKTKEYEQEMFYKDRKSQHYDILINTNLTSAEKVRAMFWLDEEKDD